eukprot:gene17076-biopygen3359
MHLLFSCIWTVPRAGNRTAHHGSRAVGQTIVSAGGLYADLKNKTCAKVLAQAPALPAGSDSGKTGFPTIVSPESLPAGDADDFMRAYRNFTGTSDEDEAPVLRLADALLSRSDVRALTKACSHLDTIFPALMARGGELRVTDIRLRAGLELESP